MVLRREKAAGAIFSLLVVSTSAGTISGPTFNFNVSGWDVYGIEFTALRNATLDSFSYKNQGRADVVILQDASSSNVINSVVVSVGNPSATVDAGWGLIAGHTYYLLGTSDGVHAPTNSPDGVFGSAVFPQSDTDITVIAGIFGNGPGATSPVSPQSKYWASFNNLVTTPAPQIQVSRVGGQVLLAWPTNGAMGLSLYTTTNLSPPVAWTLIPGVASNQFTVTNNAINASQFFRLGR